MDNRSLWIGYTIGESLESRRLLSNTLVFITSPTNTAVGFDVDSPTGVQVEIQDLSGNLVNSSDNITIALSANPGGSTLQGTLTQFAANGVATFSDLLISSSAIGYTLVATDANNSAVAAATSQPFNVNSPLAYNFQNTVSLSPNISFSGGLEPEGSLYIDATGNLFGTTAFGGIYGDGTVFEIAEPSNTYSTLISFTGNSGSFPGANPQAGLTSDGNGNLFGTTFWGGTSNDGTVFELAGPTYTFTSLLCFTGGSGTYPGANPAASLTSDGSGNLFGTAEHFGQYDCGTVFELAGPTHAFSLVVSFSGLGGQYPGATPTAALTSDDNGNLFGTTDYSSEANEGGTVFELAGPSHTFSSLLSFTSGEIPDSVTLDGSGNLFGTTEYGGISGDGTVFELAGPNHTYSPLFSFTGVSGTYLGANPDAELTSDGNGNLFGITASGGPSGDGTVFELAGPNHMFSSEPFYARAVANAVASLTCDGHGNLFGTTEIGGMYNQGTVFKFPGSAPGQLTILANFSGSIGGNPYGAVFIDPSGNLFGTTAGGGAYRNGSVFEIGEPSGAYSTLVSFTGDGGTYPGANPVAGLISDSNGNLFGTTENGGSFSNSGTVFELAGPNHTFSSLFSFTGNNGPYIGANPCTALTSDGNGNLFGTTGNGGASNDGTVFEMIGPNHKFSSLLSFTGTSGAFLGANPASTLTFDANGNLFGTTAYDGTSGNGTVFELAGPGHTFSTLVSFTGTNGAYPGATPAAGLTSDGNGNLFGTTAYGGASAEGTIFELAGPSHIFSSILSFTGYGGQYPGYNPAASLTSDGDGDLFGTTYTSGTFGWGSVFELTGPSHEFSTLFSFTGTNGAYLGAEPYGALTFDANGDLFGTTQSGGTLSQGTVFELIPSIQLSFPNTSSGAIAGAVLPSIEVNIKQSSGTLSTADSSIVTLSIQSGPNGAVLCGTTSVVAVNGVATFTNLSLSLPGNYTLIATDAALSSATSPLTIQPPTITWTGAAGDQSWSTPGNWSNNLVPTATTSATIGTGFTVQIPSGAYSVDSLTTSSPLEIATGATLQLFGPATFTSTLTVDTNATLKVAADPVLLVVNGSTFTDNGTIDLGDSDMIIHNGNLTQITPNIFSSSASTSTTLAIELNNDGHGNPLLTTFNGESVTTTDVLIKYTYFGDANLNGSVDAADYIAIDNGFNQNLTGWNNGDFNYDGKINGDDYTLIDNAYNTQNTVPLASVAAPLAKISQPAKKSAGPAINPTSTPTLSADPPTDQSIWDKYFDLDSKQLKQ